MKRLVEKWQIQLYQILYLFCVMKDCYFCAMKDCYDKIIYVSDGLFDMTVFIIRKYIQLS